MIEELIELLKRLEDEDDDEIMCDICCGTGNGGNVKKE